MSYYNPSLSQVAYMARGGRGGYSSSRSGYRGSSSRGNSSWGSNSRGGYDSRGSSGRFSSSFSHSFDSSRSFDRNKYGGSGDRFSGSRDDYHKSYRPDSNFSSRDGHNRSPDRKRPRTEAPSSRHDSSGGYGAGYYDTKPSYSERRYSSERHSTPYRREDFRRPPPPPPPPPTRGSYRGRVGGTRGSRGLKMRDRPVRRRLADNSYVVRKRALATRSSDISRRIKLVRMRRVARVKKHSGSEKEDSSDERDKRDKKEKDVEKEEDEKGVEMKTEEDEKPIKKEIDDVEEDDDEGTDRDVKNNEKPKKNFIKLVCPHCNLKVPTFRRYEMHLQSKSHLIMMRRVAMKQKSILAQMRQAQRNTQNELDNSSEDLSSKTNFCPLCKLNYKQRKSVHQASESHKNMKKFLMPFCKVCNVTFKSPMIYESHCCSIEHIKRKQRVENNSEGSAEEDNLEDFTTIDSVGDVDGNASDEDKKSDEKKEPVNVGIEQIRKVEALYCDLCKMYLSRGDDSETPKIIARHCKLRVHMQRYVRHKEREELEKRAEKLQRKETAEKEKKKEVKVEKEEKTDAKDGEKDVKDDSNKSCGEEDKIWDSVDKDLGDILAEVESGDEDDDSHVNGERYDRFKLSEGKNEDEKKKPDENVETCEETSEKEKVDEEQK